MSKLDGARDRALAAVEGKVKEFREPVEECVTILFKAARDNRQPVTALMEKNRELIERNEKLEARIRELELGKPLADAQKEIADLKTGACREPKSGLAVQRRNGQLADQVSRTQARAAVQS